MIHTIFPVQFTCLTVYLHQLCPGSLVYLLVWNFPFHTLFISSPNHCLLFATHAYTIPACYAAVPRLCHIFQVPAYGQQTIPERGVQSRHVTHFKFLVSLETSNFVHWLVMWSTSICIAKNLLQLGMVTVMWPL